MRPFWCFIVFAAAEGVGQKQSARYLSQPQCVFTTTVTNSCGQRPCGLTPTTTVYHPGHRRLIASFFFFLMHNKSTLVCSEEAKSWLLETDAQWVGVPHIFSSAGFAFSPSLRVYNNSKYLLCFKQARPALNKYHRVKGAVAAQPCQNKHFHSVRDPDGNRFVGLLFNEGKNYCMKGKGG